MPQVLPGCTLPSPTFLSNIPHVQSVSSHQVLPQNHFLLPILCHFRHPLLHLPHGPPPPPQQSPLTPNTTNRIHLISPLKCVLCSSHASLADLFQPIDVDVFQQIIDLDEDDSYEFSRSMVEDFYSQAEETFDLMDTLLCVLSPHCPHPLPHLSPSSESKDLPALSDKGHFLKGSAAAIGVQQVQRSCEEVQNYGKLQGKDESPISSQDALDRLGAVLIRVRVEYENAKDWLNQWFDDPEFRSEHASLSV